MSASKTKQIAKLVRDCFGQALDELGNGQYYASHFAIAARRFVRLENKGKMRMLEMSDIEFGNRNNNQKGK